MDASSAMQLYNTLFYVFMAVAIMGFLAAATLFFLFDIPTVFALLTGRAKKKTLERMAQGSNAEKGRDRNRKKKTASSKQKSGERQAVAGAQFAETDSPETSALRQDSMMTDVLNKSSGHSETELLTGASMSWTSEDTGATAQLKRRNNVPVGKFEIIEDTIIVHADKIV